MAGWSVGAGSRAGSDFGQGRGGVAVEGGQGLVEMGRAPAADEHGGRAGLVEGLGEGEVRGRVVGAPGDGVEAGEAARAVSVK